VELYRQPQRHGFFCTTLLPSGKVLVSGGGTAELYDASTGTFRVTGNMTEQAGCSTATLLPNGRVLITAWFSAGDLAATPEVYDPSAGTFTPTGAFVGTGAAGDVTATLLLNGKVLIAGEELIAQLYDPVSGTFSPTGAMTTPWLFGRTATLLRNGKVLFAGGASEDFGRYRNAELYDPTTGTFTATGDMNTRRDWHTATLLPDGAVLIAGGETDDCNKSGLCVFAGSTASTEIYDPTTGTFKFSANMNARREIHTATLLNNGNVLVAGGLWYAGIGGFQGFLASAELYGSGISSVFNPIDDHDFSSASSISTFSTVSPTKAALISGPTRLPRVAVTRPALK